MEEDHYSKEFDDAPMPHSIFFTKIGHAIHGTDSVGRLGTPASHGCVRLSRDNASTLYALVQKEGVLNTTVTLTGSSQVALARNPRGRNGTAVARRAPQDEQYGTAAAGDPVVLTPQPREYPAQARADDGYIYPADGSSTDRRYPAPPSSRRVYDAQGYGQYGNQGYAPAPQGYTSRGRTTSSSAASTATATRTGGSGHHGGPNARTPRSETLRTLIDEGARHRLQDIRGRSKQDHRPAYASCDGARQAQ